MPKFRKKPVVIEARQYDGSNAHALVKWMYTNRASAVVDHSHRGPALPTIKIYTLEGEYTASLYDWIIKGTAGEFYPCKPDIFDATHEAIDGQETETQAEAQAETQTA